jgi:hypothetical protein
MDITKSYEFIFLYLINKCILLFKYINNNDQKNILIDIKFFINNLNNKISNTEFNDNIKKKNKILEILIEYFESVIQNKIYKLLNNDSLISIIEIINKEALEICYSKINSANQEKSNSHIDTMDLSNVNKSSANSSKTFSEKISVESGVNKAIIPKNNNYVDLQECLHEGRYTGMNSQSEKNNSNIENIIDSKIKNFIIGIENNIKNSLKDHINYTESVEYDLDKKFNTKIEKNNIFIENKIREIIRDLINNKNINIHNNILKNEINDIYKYIEHKILNKENGENIKIIENKINEIDKNFKHNIDKSKSEIKDNLNYEIENKIKILSDIFNENIQSIFQNLNNKLINNEKELYKIIEEKLFEYENTIKKNNFNLFFDKDNNEIKLLYQNELITSTKINIKGLIGPKGPQGNQGDKGDTPIFRKILFTDNNKLKFIIQDTQNIYELLSEGNIPLGPQGLKGERGDPGKTYIDLKWNQDNVMRIDDDHKDSLIFLKSLCIGENSHCLKDNSLSIGGGICYQNNSIAIGNNSKTLDNESIALFGSCIGKKSFSYRSDNIDENGVGFGKKDKNNYNINSFSICSKEINFECDNFNIKTNHYDNNKLTEFENRISLIEKKLVDLYKRI